MDIHSLQTTPARWKHEVVIIAGTFAFGFFALPAAIYWVGQGIIGEYADDNGFWALAENIWSDLLSLDPAAWALVLSPTIVVTLLRAARRLSAMQPL